MNKKLLAIAVGAAMVAGSAAAMADATVYGKVHLSIDSLDNGASGSVASGGTDNSGIYVSSNSSRLGIKGSEDLGNGLSAIYKYEMSTDYSSKNLAGDRNAYLGLKGGFGTFLAGRHDTPFKTIGRKNDLFGDTIADSRNLTNDGGNDARATDVLVYANQFGAVDLAAAYVPDDGTVDAGGYSVSLGFAQGPLGVAVATQSTNKGSFTPVDKSATASRLTASYKMGSAAIHALYQQETAMGGADGADGDTWGLGASFKSGMNTFKLQYFDRSNDVASGAPKDDGNMVALGVDHSMSKMTKVYAVYASMSNDDGANYGLGGSGHDKASRPTPSTGNDYSGFSVGMITKF